MDVLVAGAHGQIGQRLVRQLVESGHRALGLIRNPDHAADVEALGGRPVVADLESDLDPIALEGAQAIVFAAGAGPGSGEARKETMDKGGAIKLIEAAEQEGVRRYVMVSAMGASDPGAGPEQMQPYLRAKGEADERLAASSLEWTIVRPGSLTDDAGTGKVDAAESLGRSGEIPREDVAAIIVACLEEPSTASKTFEILSGDTPIVEAVLGL